MGLLLFGAGEVRAQQVDDEDDQASKGKLLEAPEISYETNRADPGLAKSAANIVYEYGFETDSSDWTREGTWAIGEPTSGPNSGYQSTGAGATNLSGDHPNNADDRLISPFITLPAVSSSERVLLHVREWFEIESCCDDGIIEVSADSGSTWTQLGNRAGSQTSWRDIQVDLTQFAGQDIQIAFRFSSDASVVNSGWYVDDLQIDVNRPDPLTTEFRSINPQNFPTVFSNVVVDTFGTGIPSLTASNFEVYEDGVLQTDNFEVTPPQQSGGVRQVDIVFLMDNSGSMQEEQNDVRNNVFNFVDSLEAGGVDFNLGLTRFGADANGGDPILEDNGSLTDRADYFRNNLWPRNTIDGGFEPGWDALYESAAGFNFRPGAQRVFILITDENITGSDDNVGQRTESETEQFLIDQGVTNYSLIDSSDAAARDDYGDIAEATGGRLFDVFSPFSPILDEISGTVSNSYVLKYRASNTQRDGTERTVRVEVDFDGNVARDTTSYIVGAAPEITRTDSTRSFSDQAWAQGTEFTIEAKITDDVSPLVQSATLFYKLTPDSVFTTTSMSAVNDSIYQATIPSAAVDSPGVDYYIRATDGESTVSRPSTDARSDPYQIAVLPNEPPSIQHTPVTNLTPGSPIPITATATDNTNSLASVTLFYRQTGDLTYTSLSMSNTSGDTYEATIPGSDVTQTGISYYISATDNFGVSSTVGSADRPLGVTSSACPLTWALEVETRDSNAVADTLTLGQSPGATAGLDSDCGESELPPVPPAPQTDTRLVGTDISGVDLGEGSLVDIRPDDRATPDPLSKSRFAAAAIWRVSLQSDDYPFTLNWDQSAVVDSLPGETVRLVDAATGGNVVYANMKETGSATISNTSVEAVEIQVGQLTAFEMTLNDGWNFKSLPVEPPNSSFGAVMDPCRSAFGFDPQQGYTPVEVEDSLNTGNGYWFNCSAGTVEITGVSSALDVNVDAGWNIVGPFTDSIDVSTVVASNGQITSDFYGFDQNTGYSAAGMLAPLQAYWVKTTQSGSLNFYAGKSKGQPVAKSETPDTRLVVSGASGSRASLYLASNLSEEALSRYELPPKPPSGITDVRFEGDRKAASFSGTEDAQFKALELEGIEAPVELRLEGSSGDAVKIKQGNDVVTTLTSESPSVTVQKTSGLAVALSQTKSVEYFLREGYPNPVYEQATIQYGLPEAAEVQIELYDILGRNVGTLVNERKSAGTHSVNLKVDHLSSGKYFYRMSAGSFVKTRSLTVTR